MSWISDIKYELNMLDTSLKKLRQFGIVIGPLVGIIVLWFYYPDPISLPGYIILSFSVVLFLLGIIYPKSLNIIYILWMAIAFALGWIVSRFLLTILFLLVLMPIGLIAKILKKEFIETDFTKKKGSYWIQRGKHTINYEKMF